MDNNKICKIHNEPIQFCQKDALQNLVWLCKFCIQQKFNLYNAEDVENESKLDQQDKLVNNLSVEVDSKVNKQINIKEITEFNKKFDYQLMQKLSYKQNEWCCAIAFNQDATLMIAGFGNLIKIFEFKDNKLKEVQQLHAQSGNVSCLLFMKKSNQFISASHDSTISIWEYNQNNQWKINQVLKGHTSNIRCVTINQNEDLLISGSQDKTIKFWIKQNNIWSVNQSIDCQKDVYSISLSVKEDKLIASIQNYQILILQLQGQQWMIKKKIQVEKDGCRLCFINQNQFVFQPNESQYLQIFDYDPKVETFKKRQEIKYLNKESDGIVLFPIHYISQIGLIMVKHGDFVHIIKRSQNGKFTVEQSINFNTRILYGSMTNDGRYLATWDDESQEIQIKKFDY